MKLWLNRLPSAFPRVVEAFSDAGFDAIALPCVQSYPLDVSLDPAIVDFDRFDNVVVTSPESARLLIDAVLTRWVKWPAKQQFWATGVGTAEILKNELYPVRIAPSPGSESLIQLMFSEVRSNSQILIASGKDSGRQFDELNSALAAPVAHLELFELVPQFDLANSSSERFTLSHGSALCEDVISKTRNVLTNMWVDADRCLENIKAQRGLVMAEKVMIELVEHGIPRDEAHEILRSASFEAVDKKIELIDVCSRTPEITAAFSAEELEAMFEPMNHIGVSGEIVDECVKLARDAISN